MTPVEENAKDTFIPASHVNINDASLDELGVETLLDALHPATVAGREWLRDRLSNPTTDGTVLRARQDQIRTIRTLLKTSSPSNALLQTNRALLATTESSIHTMADAAKDSRHADFYNQLLWAPDSIAAPLNTWGWFTELVVVFRSLILPALAVLMPILLFLAPIVSLLVSGDPITAERYWNLLQIALRKAVPSGSGIGIGSGSGRFTSPFMLMAEQCMSVGASLVMLVATAWSQVSTGLSIHRVVVDMRSRATATQQSANAIQQLVNELRKGGVHLESHKTDWPLSTLATFGMAWNHPDSIRIQLNQMGELDGLLTLALAKRTCFPQFADATQITDLWHPGLTRKGGSRVYNSIDLRSPTHVLLTGPNRGGKTTILTSLGAAVLMSQTVGIVFARRATLPLFGAIRTSLRPVDTLGKRSLFETEIDIACKVHAIAATSTPTHPLFLLMDEIFHGTNARDGVEAAEVFLDRLYKTVPGSVISIISTHYAELPVRYGPSSTSPSVQTLCMDAHVDPANPDRIISTYRLRTGVNSLSSVREILRERGLLGPSEPKSPIPNPKTPTPTP